MGRAMVLPNSMREIVFSGSGGPEVIAVKSASLPIPNADQVLIEVQASGVNRPDCMQRQGVYPPPPGESNVPGLEVSGTIVACGNQVSHLKPGDRVCALVGSGGYADYAVAYENLCLPIPKPLDFIQAAALPENFFTVYDNVFTRGKLNKGEVFLVHGGSSGIGSTAVQLARQVGCSKVIVTAGSEEKCQFCRDLGAQLAINYRQEDFVEAVKQFSPHGADVILDMVGGDYIRRNIDILNLEGRLILISFQQGSKLKEFNFLPILARRLTITGSSLRPRTVAQKSRIAASLLKDVWPLLEAGSVKPWVTEVFSLEDAAKAHRLMESGDFLGKIVLRTH